MKTVLYLILALIVLSIVWGIVKALLAGVVSLVFHVAMIALFCWVVYMIYKALTANKLTE